MQRQTVYPGQEVLETDLLGAQRGVYIGFCKLGESLMGSASAIHHMPCVPGAGLSVEVGPGELYMNQADDATAWSSLEADSTTMLKQGLSLTTQSLSTPAPPTSGQSIVYLIEGAVQQTDGGAAVLPYYKSATAAYAASGGGGALGAGATAASAAGRAGGAPPDNSFGGAAGVADVAAGGSAVYGGGSGGAGDSTGGASIYGGGGGTNGSSYGAGGAGYSGGAGEVILVGVI